MATWPTTRVPCAETSCSRQIHQFLHHKDNMANMANQNIKRNKLLASHPPSEPYMPSRLSHTLFPAPSNLGNLPRPGRTIPTDGAVHARLFQTPLPSQRFTSLHFTHAPSAVPSRGCVRACERPTDRPTEPCKGRAGQGKGS
jgi:hypothetical protein